MCIRDRGTDALVTPAFKKPIAETDCVNCGQCRVYCPTGAITIRTNMEEVWRALADPDVRVVAQIAPAVRVAVGEAFGMPRGSNSIGKVVSVLHRKMCIRDRRMTEGEPSPPVRKSPGMGWLFIRIQRKSENTEK